MYEEELIKSLLADVGSEDRKVRNEALDTLIKLLTDEDEEIQTRVSLFLHELTDVDDTRAVEAILGALEDKSVDIRFRAAYALRQIADLRMVEAMLAAMDFRYNSDAVEGLSKIEVPYEGPTIVDWTVGKAVIEKLGRSGNTSAVKPLLRIYNSDDDGHYFSAILRALEKLGDPAFEILIISLNDEIEDIRIAATVFLGELVDLRAVEPLIKALSNEKAWIRKIVVEALGQLGDIRGMEPLIEVLAQGNEDWLVREAAARALGKIGDARAMEHLIRTLTRSNENWLIREAAARALGKIGDTRAVEPLIETYTMTDKKQFLTTIIVVLRVDFKVSIIPLFVSYLLAFSEEKTPPFLNNILALFLRWSSPRDELREQLLPLKPLLDSLVLTGDEDVQESSKALLEKIKGRFD